MAISDLPTTPLQTMDEATFNAAVAAFLPALTVFKNEANALAAGVNSAAAGSAFSLPYTFSTTTTDADPGAGFLRFNSGTQNATTVLRIDSNTALNQDVSSLLDTFDDSSSALKGHIRIVKPNDATKWAIFSVTSIASPTGYRNITVAPVLFSTANPFTNGDSIVLHFQRTGDQGNAGTLNRRYFGPGSTLTAINIDNYDMVAYTGLTGSATIPAPTGTLSQGRGIMMMLTDNGTARALSYNATWNGGTDLPLPSSTQVGKYLWLGFIYNGTRGAWDLVSVLFV